MSTKNSPKTPKRTVKKAGSLVSSPIEENFTNRSPAMSASVGAIVSPKPGSFSGKRVGDRNTPDSGPEAGNVGAFSGLISPSGFPGGGISGAYEPDDLSKLYGPGFVYGVPAAFAIADDAELSPHIQAMKDFDAMKAATPNNLVIGHNQEAIHFKQDPENNSAPGGPVAYPSQNWAATPSQIPQVVPDDKPGEGNQAVTPAPFENSVEPSAVDGPGVESQPQSDTTRFAMSSDSEHVTPTKALSPANPPLADLEAIQRSLEAIAGIGTNLVNDAILPTVSDVGASGSEPLGIKDACQEPAVDQHQYPIPTKVNDDFNLPSPTKALPEARQSDPADHGKLACGDEGASSGDSTRPASARQQADTTSGSSGSPSKTTYTTCADLEEDLTPPSCDIMAVAEDSVSQEEDSSADDPMDEDQPQTRTDTTAGYQFPSEEQVQARARTAGRALFSREATNLDDLQNSDGEVHPLNRAAGKKASRPGSSVPPGVRLAPYKSAPLKIPVPDTMHHFFPSSKVAAPKWAPNTLYFPGGRIVDPSDPDYRFFDQRALQPPCPPKSSFARKTPLPRDNSIDARGLCPELNEKKIPSIYDFIDRICPDADKNKQIAINTNSVEDFIKSYYVEGPDGSPVLTNPPTGPIPQVEIDDAWFPRSVLERYRIERVIKLLDLSISPPTRAALFWILIERQTKRTRELLSLFAQHPGPTLKDVEKQLISWGYLPEGCKQDWPEARRELALMDPKEVIKLDVVKETEEMLSALRDAAGSERKLKFLLPFIGKYCSHNMSFFGLMGSDRMIELVQELCNCLQAVENDSHLPGFDIQMGIWTFIDELKPSVFIARSTSLCDLEYLYMVTRHAEVHLDVMKMVARVMAPVIKRVSEHDDIPQRRELPEERKKSLEQTGNSQITCYLEAQLPPVVLPTAWELGAPMRAKMQRIREEQERLAAQKLEERQKVMIARVEYMEEDIHRDLAIRPAEIYSPKKRRQMIDEGRARNSRSSKRRVSITGSVVAEEQAERPQQILAEPTGVKPRMTRKRLMDEVLGEMAGPPKYRRISRAKRVSIEIAQEKAITVATSRESNSAGKQMASNDPEVVALRLPSMTMKPGSKVDKASTLDSRQVPWESLEDSSDSASVGDDSEEEYPSARERHGNLQPDDKDKSSPSDEGDDQRANQPQPKGREARKKGLAFKKAKDAVLKDTRRPEPVPAGRVPSPVHLASMDAPVRPTWILPDLDDHSDETYEEQPRKAPICATKLGAEDGVCAEKPRKTLISAQVVSQVPHGAPRVPSPVHTSTRSDTDAPAWILPDLDDGSDEADGEAAGKAAFPPSIVASRRAVATGEGADILGLQKRPNDIPTSAAQVPSPASTPKINSQERGSWDMSGVASQCPPPHPRACGLQTIEENDSDISDEDETPKPASHIAESKARTPPRLSPASQPLRRSPRKHQLKRLYNSDSTESDKEDDGDDYCASQTNHKKERIKVADSKKATGSGQNTSRTEKPTSTRVARAGTITARGRGRKQPQVPVTKVERDRSDEEEGYGSVALLRDAAPNVGQKTAGNESDISDEDETPKPTAAIAGLKVQTPPRLAPVIQAVRRSPRKHNLKRLYDSDSSTSDEGDEGDDYCAPPTHHKNKRIRVAENSKATRSGKNTVKTEKTGPTRGVPDGAAKAKGKKGQQRQAVIAKVERGQSAGERVDSRGLSPKAAPHVQQKTADESDISDEDETPGPAAGIIAEQKIRTPPLSAPIPHPLRRSPRKHRPIVKLERDSSSTDDDSDGDCDGDDNIATLLDESAKLDIPSEGASNQGSQGTSSEGRKPLRNPPLLGSKAGPAKTAAEKAAARSAAGKKAAATRAANHKAFVDRITAELVAEAKRAADAGGYRQGAVTQTQVKRRMKREKERMKREAAQEKLEMAAAMREQAAEARKIAAEKRQSSAAEKRAATIAARKAAIGVKAQVVEPRAGSQGNGREPKGKTTEVKIKREKVTAQDRIEKLRAELEAAELALAAGREADLSSGDEEYSGESEGGGEENAQWGAEPPAQESADEMEAELALEILRQEAEEDAKAEAAKREREVSERNRLTATEVQEKADILAGAGQYRRSQREIAARARAEARETRKDTEKRKRNDLVEQAAMEDQANTLKSFLDTTCAPKKYSWMEGHETENGESSEAGGKTAAKTGYETADKGKRRRLNPRK